jgi:crotonobetainyl-CoA:carnitine CoA-transferase CaiB-like acyl-CoA transferase
MTVQPMKGVRVLEVAQYTFVPSAGAVLADWGAEVIKVEHAERGDAARGQTHLGAVHLPPGEFNPLIEHSNRGKRSIGLSLNDPEALDVLLRIAQTCDVFLTNLLPDSRQKLGIDVDDIRRANPKIIYVRGSAHGNAGPDRDRGGFDVTSFWARGGGAAGSTPPNVGAMIGMPGPAYGDSIGGLSMAGGIAAALFARERTGEPSVIDVSLLSVGAWASGLAIDISLLTGAPWTPGDADGFWSAPTNPLSGYFRTKDNRWIVLHLNQMWRYWPDFWRRLGRIDVLADPRFSTAEDVRAQAAVVARIVADEIGQRSLPEWETALGDMEGPWAVAQDSVAVGQDSSLRANGYIAPLTDVDGVTRELVANPIQFDEQPATLTRAPLFAENTYEILTSLDFDDEDIAKMMSNGAVS